MGTINREMKKCRELYEKKKVRKYGEKEPK